MRAEYQRRRLASPVSLHFPIFFTVHRSVYNFSQVITRSLVCSFSPFFSLFLLFFFLSFLPSKSRNLFTVLFFLIFSYRVHCSILRCFFFSFLFLVVPSYSLFLFISHVVDLSLPGAQRTTSDCFELLERSCCVVGVSFSSRCESFL